MILVKVHEPERLEISRIEIFPCVIGRSMHCGVRIDDPSVSARHAEVHATVDGYLLRDMHSTNGIWLRGERVREVALAALETVYLGDVRLDFITKDIPERTHANRLLPHEHSENTRWVTAKIVIGLLLALLIAGLVPAVDQYQLYWPPERFGSLLGKAVLIWLATVAAAFIVSLFCKLNVKQFHFYNVLLLITFTFATAKATSVFMPMVIFNLHNLVGASYLRHLGYGLIVFGFLFKLQKYALRRWTVRHRALGALGAGLLATILTEVVLDLQLGDREHMAELALPFDLALGLKPGADDLLFDIGLTITATDQERIRTLERLEADRY